jgi:hypothetical protein
MFDAVVQIATGAGAIVTGAAAVGSYRRLGQLLERVDDNETRSETNRQILVGEREHIDGVLERLQRVEDAIDRLQGGSRDA